MSNIVLLSDNEQEKFDKPPILPAEFRTTCFAISDIGEDDMEKAMNYVGQELGVTLFKVVHEIPLPLRGKEILLRGIEALLGNILYGKFKEYDPHKLIDLISEHVHMGLKDLETKIKQFPSKNSQK